MSRIRPRTPNVPVLVAGLLAVLSLSACRAPFGGGDDDAAKAPEPAPTSSVQVVGPTPAADLPPAAPRGKAPELAGVEGYAYARPDAALVKDVIAVSRQNRQVVNAVTYRSVTANGSYMGDIVVLGLAKQYTGSQTFKRQFIVSVADGLQAKGGETATRRVGQQLVVTVAGSPNVAAAYAGGTLVVVRSAASLDEVAKLVGVYARNRGGDTLRETPPKPSPNPSPVG